MNSALQFTLSKFETVTVFVCTSPPGVCVCVCLCVCVCVCVCVYACLDVCIFAGLACINKIY